MCNTNGLSGIPAAAVIGGASTNAFLDVVGGSVPPLVALGRVFSRPLKPIVDNTPASGDGASNLAPFPDSVLIQLAKGVIASNFGLNDPNLLAETFKYLEPLMGPLDKDKYLQVFTNEYDVRSGVPDLDYGLQVRVHMLRSSIYSFVYLLLCFGWVCLSISLLHSFWGRATASERSLADQDIE